MNGTRKTLLTFAITIVLAAPALAKGHKHQPKGDQVWWHEVPAAAQTTIQNSASGGKITRIAKENKNGALIYAAEVKGTDGKMSRVTVTDAGKLLGVKQEKEHRKHKHFLFFGS